MAVTAPEAPSLHFKERSGFITKRAIFRDDVEPQEEAVEDDEEYVEDEESEGEEYVEEESEEEFFEDEPSELEEYIDEVFEEEPFEEEEFFEEEETPVEEAPSVRTTIEQAQPPPPARREQNVTVQAPDTGGRTGSALPTPAEMAAYAQEDRGKAIIRHFEEEDRRMSESRETNVEVETRDESFFNIPIEPPTGGLRWIVLIAALAICGFIFVRQLTMTPRSRSAGFAPDVATRATELKEQATTGREAEAEYRRQNSMAAQSRAQKEEALRTASRRSSQAETLNTAVNRVAPSKDQSENLGEMADERPAVMRALREVSAAYAAEEAKPKTPRPRPAPKPESKSDDVRHIEIRV